MLDAINESLSFVENRELDDLFEDRMLALSLIKEIEIIGEAASRITKDTKDKFPDIPWKDIVGMRNRLIHAYFDIDFERVWYTITIDLLTLKPNLDKIINAL